MALRMRPLDLRVSSDLSWGLPSSQRPPHATAKTEGEHGRVHRRVQGWFDQVLARLAVRQGAVPPYLYALRRGIERRFQPTAAILPRRKAAQEYWHSYRNMARAAARLPYSPFASRRWRPGVVPELEARAALRAAAETHAQRFEVEFCVTLESGRPPRLERTRRSGLLALDRLARQALRQSLTSQRAPQGLCPQRACYLFGIRYGRAFTGLTLAWSLDALRGGHSNGTFFRKRVRLIGVRPPVGGRWACLEGRTRRKKTPAAAVPTRSRRDRPRER